jgi:hypothetical protein
VAGQSDGAATPFGAMVPAIIRGNIVVHRFRVCPTLTRPPTGVPP